MYALASYIIDTLNPAIAFSKSVVCLRLRFLKVPYNICGWLCTNDTLVQGCKLFSVCYVRLVYFKEEPASLHPVSPNRGLP